MNYDEAKATSPCKKLCELDKENALCIGCGRSVEEIALWSDFGGEERLAILTKLPERLAARMRTARAAEKWL